MKKKTPPSIAYSFAARDDKGPVRELLSECGLPTRYVHRHLKSFLVAKAAGEIVGVVGMEPYGRVGLLRSLCVDPDFREEGIAREMNRRIMEYARSEGIERLYLFTVRAEKFAARLGFRRLERARIPGSIRSTWQYRSFKPYPVICMVKEIRRRTRQPSRRSAGIRRQQRGVTPGPRPSSPASPARSG